MSELFTTIWHFNNGLPRSLFYALVAWLGFTLGAFLLSRKFAPAIQRRIDEDKHPIFTIMLQAFRRPISVFLQVSGVAFALLIFSAWRPEDGNNFWLKIVTLLPAIVYRCWRIATILIVTWGLLSSSKISRLVLQGTHGKLDLKVGESVAHFLAAIFKVVVIAIAAIILLSEFNININGLITGLGLGGLTIALAAKDSAANFFGGLILVVEKPFDIGDWIVADGIEGTVESINLRSTSVRTSPGALTIVPNANLSGAAITNWSGGMEQRRASYMLSLPFNTPQQKIREFSSAVRDLLRTDKNVVPDSGVVRFAEFGPSSLSIQVIFYTTLPGFKDHLRIKERINYAILELADQMGLSFAYPSQTVYVQPFAENPPPHSPSSNE